MEDLVIGGYVVKEMTSNEREDGRQEVLGMARELLTEDQAKALEELLQYTLNN